MKDFDIKANLIGLGLCVLIGVTLVYLIGVLCVSTGIIDPMPRTHFGLAPWEEYPMVIKIGSLIPGMVVWQLVVNRAKKRREEASSA